MACLEDLRGDDRAEVLLVPLALHLVGGQQVGAERRVFGFELNDRLAVGWGKRPIIIDGLSLEEALHGRLVEAADCPIDCAGGNPGLLGALDGSCTEHDDGPN